jgi:M6 family metalloprotease-like protein
LLSCLTLAVLTGWASRAAAQYPRARIGEFEVRGFDFDPAGGWRKVAARVMDARRVLLRSGQVARLNAAGSRPAVRGNFAVPVIPIAFSDVDPPFAPAAYQDLLFSANPVGRAWSVKTYYAAASRGNISLDGYVFDWVRVPKTASYYEDGCNGIGVAGPCPARADSRMGELLKAALDSVSNAPGGDTVWNRYDNDGPDGVPNSGDDDGVVDVVAFLQPLLDGACGGAGIWSHRATIGNWNNGQPYVTRTPRRNSQGAAIPGAFITINSYTIQSALGGDQACTDGQLMPIGTVTHETGHAFGLPDLYDTDPNSGTQGAGEWSLMASGPYARPYSPSSFDAWSLVQLGWVTVDTLASGVTQTIPPVQTSGTVYYAATDQSQYFLVENRGAIGTDSAQMNPAFVRAKLPGLLLWQINDDRVAAGMVSNRVNTGAVQGVALIQADGLNQLRTPFGGNRGDGGDAFPGSTANRDFGLMTAPASVDDNLAPYNVRFDRIALAPDGGVTFRYVRRAPTVVIAQRANALVRVNGVARIRYAEVVAPGDVLDLSVDSVQLSADGRTRSQFLAWSDGGAPAHALIARSGAPDSVTAYFATANRLRITVTGPGSVASTLSGAVGSGAFADAGSSVHLEPTAAVGAEFVGWRGDTTTRGAIDLSMDRPYDLAAVFVPTVTIDAGMAARALMGGPQLSAAQVAYLDAIGNQNGSYDVGDYLAWLRRNALPVTTRASARRSR